MNEWVSTVLLLYHCGGPGCQVVTSIPQIQLLPLYHLFKQLRPHLVWVFFSSRQRHQQFFTCVWLHGAYVAVCKHTFLVLKTRSLQVPSVSSTSSQPLWCYVSTCLLACACSQAHPHRTFQFHSPPPPTGLQIIGVITALKSILMSSSLPCSSTSRFQEGRKRCHPHVGKITLCRIFF